MALALAALEVGPPEAAAPVVESLVRLVESTPLERLDGAERANSRQRTEAARRMGFWLVARECRNRPGLVGFVPALEAGALEGASRQADPAWSIAMLRESAQVALDRGDRAGAEAAWGRMLATILPRPAVAKAEPGKKAGVPVATLDRFERATALARLAAGRGMVAFSLRAALEPLRGGPPVVPLTVRTSAGTARNPADRAKDQAVDRAVQGRLAELDVAWDAAHAPAEEVYRMLREVVLPDGRPSEVFAYPAPPGDAANDRPSSVAGLLVRWAVRADRAADLRQALQDRGRQATAEGAARTILALLDLECRDFAATTRGLQALASLVGSDKLQSTAEVATLAALPALAIPEAEAAARSVLEAATTNLVSSAAEGAAVRLDFLLARAHFAAGRPAEGRQRVQAALEALERATAAGQSAYRNYGYAFQTRRQNLQVVAAEYARGGQWDEALEALGQSADAPIQPVQGSTPTPPMALVAVARHLAGLPAGVRYEKLRAWTMPDDRRATIRSLAAFAPTLLPPEAAGRAAPVGDESGLVSTLELLVIAAKEAGQLNALTAEVGRAAEAKREGAEALRDLVEIAGGRGAGREPAFRALLAEWTKKAEEPAPSPTAIATPIKPLPWSDYLRLRAALSDPKLASLALALAEKSPRSLDDPAIQGHLRLDVAASRLGRGEADDPGLAWWVPIGRETAATGRQGAVAGRWIAQGGHVFRRGGWASEATDAPGRPEMLVFRLPLAGRFTFRVDATGPGGSIGYGGLMMTATDDGRWARSRSTYSRSAATAKPGGAVRAIGGDDAISRPAVVATGGESVRLAVEVEPGSVKFLANGHVVFEDRDPSPACPWLVLGAYGDADLNSASRRPRSSSAAVAESAVPIRSRRSSKISRTYSAARSAPRARPSTPAGFRMAIRSARPAKSSRPTSISPSASPARSSTKSACGPPQRSSQSTRTKLRRSASSPICSSRATSSRSCPS